MVDKITDYKLRILSLYRCDYSSYYHVRELAKLIKKSHVTLLPHLRALEKDKILTSKKAGKNKVYSLNFDNILTKDYMILAEKFASITFLEKSFMIKKIHAETISLNIQNAFVLFGSYAKGSETKESDIDLFFLGEIKEDIINKIKVIGKIYNKTINVKKSSFESFEKGLRTKDTLVKEIIKDHIILQNSEMFISALWRYYVEIR